MIDAFRYLRDFAEHLAKEGISFKDGFQKQAMLRRLYHDLFDIEDVGRNKSPLELVRMQSKQGHAGLGPIQHVIERYRLSGVYEVYHIELGEFLELEYPLAMWLLSSAKSLFDKLEKSKSDAVNSLLNTMK